MSKIDELIEELCPEGVPTRLVADLFAYEQPTKYLVSSTDYVDSGIPVLTAGQTFLLGHTIETDGIYPASPEAPVIIFDDFTTGFQWVDFSFRAKSSAMKMITPRSLRRDELRFLYHWMGARNFRPGEHARHWISVYSQFEIPSPPLDVQREIVSILDKFTQLEAELEAELEARRIQYEVTRDRLLDFSGDLDGHPLRDELHSLNTGPVTQKKLGEVGQFIRGSGLEKKDLLGSGEPVVHYGEVHTHYGFWTETTKSFVAAAQAKKMRKAGPGDVVIVTTSENHEDVGKPLAWLGSQPLNVGGESYIYQSELDPLYVAQLFLSSSFKRTSRRYISGTKVKRLSSDNLERIDIPVPPLEIQRKIGVALKDLDALLNDITIGLPAEIAARRKQYEYYRNKLLTFKELEAV